jgi:hypothetical protein
MNKKITSVALAATLAFGTIATASTAKADSDNAMGVQSRLTTVLSGLVANATITQAQSNAITAALLASAPVKPAAGINGLMGGGFGMNSAAHQAVITTTLGITAAELKAARTARIPLGTLAGVKKAALITAIVNFETTEIDAAVTAGKITAAQAVTAKAGLLARVTAAVDSVPGPKMNSPKKGNKMHGADDDRPMKKSGNKPSIK